MTPAELLRHEFVGRMSYPIWSWVAFVLLGAGLLAAIIACCLIEGMMARATLGVAALIDATILLAINHVVTRCRRCSGAVTVFCLDLNREEAAMMLTQAQAHGIGLKLPRDGWFRACERFRISGYACGSCQILYNVGVSDPDAPSPP